jgi:hypothetical protein
MKMLQQRQGMRRGGLTGEGKKEYKIMINNNILDKYQSVS